MDDITGGRLLARNTVLNLFGQGTPLVVALFTIPILIDGLGIERFGVLTLAWIVLGYFSLFDLGLGRALTKLVAEKVGTGRELEIPPLVWTALFLMLLLGLAGSAVLGLLAPLLVRDMLKISEALQIETQHTFYLLALSIPVVISTAGLRGLLEAHQRFGLITAIRIPMAAFTFLGPVLVLPFSRTLVAVVAVLVAGRLLAWLAHLLLCLQAMPALRREISLQRGAIGPLLRFGGWMTMTNVISPLMLYMDRFLIGALVSVVTVAYYATPYEMVTKMFIVSTALTGVLFPAFVTSLAQDSNRAVLLFKRGLKYTFLALFPPTLLIVTLAYEGIDFWLGVEFAQNSTRVLQLLAVGVFVTSMAQIPFAVVQAAGRPDLGAKLVLIEFPFYLLVLWWLLGTFGIEGAAVAYLVRSVEVTLVLFVMAWRLLPANDMPIQRAALIVGGALLTLALAALSSALTVKIIFLSLTLPTFVLAAWFLILSPPERAIVQKRIKIAKRSTGGD